MTVPPTHTRSGNILRRLMLVLLLTTTIVYAASPSASDDFTSRRLGIGAKIFRALLAADMDLDTKAAKNGDLRICLLYVDDTKNSEIVEKALGKDDTARIRDKNINIELVRYDEYFAKHDKRYAGIYLTQTLNNKQLSQLLSQKARQRFIVFSPFEGDVERGVPSGIAIEARVRPYLNMAALQRANIHLKTFFLQVAKKHE